MTPEQISQAVSIPAESVTTNGSIDWTAYAQRLVDTFELAINAGGTEAEYQQLLDQGGNGFEAGSALASRYDDAILPAIGVEGVDFRGIAGLHQAQTIIGWNSWLKETEPVNTQLEFVGVEVANETPHSAYLSVTYHITDNFFSSGTLDSQSSTDTSFLEGRSTDMDKDVVVNVNVDVSDDGTLKVMSVTNG